MTVQLPPDLESIVQRAISSGHGSDETDVLRQALQLYDEFVDRRESLKQKIEKGIRSGPSISGEIVFRELEQIARRLDANTTSVQL